MKPPCESPRDGDGPSPHPAARSFIRWPKPPNTGDRAGRPPELPAESPGPTGPRWSQRRQPVPAAAAVRVGSAAETAGFVPSIMRMDGGRRAAPRDHERIQRPATQSDPDHLAQPGSQRLTYIVWVIIALSLVTSIKFVMGCLCTLLLPSDAMLCHTSTVYP